MGWENRHRHFEPRKYRDFGDMDPLFGGRTVVLHVPTLEKKAPIARRGLEAVASHSPN